MVLISASPPKKKILALLLIDMSALPIRQESSDNNMLIVQRIPNLHPNISV